MERERSSAYPGPGRLTGSRRRRLSGSGQAPELRRDPLSGRWTAIAPGRARRPGAPVPALEPPSPEELEACPFCEGREDRTPPETFALRPDDRLPDAPGWSVRIVPNLFPAFERQEVVVHTPRHARSIGELDEAELLAVARAWAARANTARRDGFAYVHALVNEGREAGASLAHTHSQLVWLREEPPVPAAEREGSGCRLCALARAELEAGARVVVEADGLLLLCPPASRGAYEMMVVPHAEHAPDAFADPETLGKALALLADGVRRLERLEGRPPLNAWLHTAAFGGDGHWHLELLPRLAVLAGLELGAGIYVTSVAPEAAAQALRAASGPGEPAPSSSAP